MRRYTKHLQTILQTKNTCKTQKNQPTPHTMEHGKKKDARVHYTVLTQHTHTTTTTHQTGAQSSTVQANKTTTTTHTVQLLCAAPDTQQHANTLKTLFVNQLPPGLLRSTSCTAGMHPPGILKQKGGSHTHGDSTTNTHNRGHFIKIAP